MKINASNAVNLILELIIVGVIFGLLYYLIDKAPFIPEPWKTWIKYVLIFLVVVAVINFLLTLIGHPLISWR